MLACWASSGYTAAGCQALETQLRACMDAPVRYRSSSEGRGKDTDRAVIAETENREEEYDQLPSVEDVSQYRGP